MTATDDLFRSRAGGPADDEVGTIRVQPDHDPASRYARRFVLTDCPLFPWVPLTGHDFVTQHRRTHRQMEGWPVQSSADFAAVLTGGTRVPLPAESAESPRAVVLAAARAAYARAAPGRMSDHVADQIGREVLDAVLPLIGMTAVDDHRVRVALDDLRQAARAVLFPLGVRADDDGDLVAVLRQAAADLRAWREDDTRVPSGWLPAVRTGWGRCVLAAVEGAGR